MASDFKPHRRQAEGRPIPQRDPEADVLLRELEGTTMKRYLIERDIAGVGTLDRQQLQQAAATSNAALAKLSGRAQWVQSFVVDDKTFCIYLADDESSVHEHARLSGFPASRVTEVRSVIEPMTAA
jgi:hypothetical protein